MYSLEGPFPGTQVDPGTNLLVAGPPMTGKRDLGLELLADGNRQENGAIVVSTKDSGDRMLSEYERWLDDDDQSIVRVVDCVSKQQGMSPSRTENVAFTSSPVDMTRIGIELSEFLEELYSEGVHENRVLFHSLSTLLMYSDLQTVFRFLHVFTGRVQSADALGLFVIDASAHDDQTMSTLRQLFDGEIEVREGDDGDPQFRLKGVGDTQKRRHS